METAINFIQKRNQRQHFVDHDNNKNENNNCIMIKTKGKNRKRLQQLSSIFRLLTLVSKSLFNRFI